MGALTALLFLSLVAAEEPCHRVAQKALGRAIQNQPLTRADLKGCWGTLHELPGSENIPLMSSAAAVAAGLQRPEDLLPWLRGESPFPPEEQCSPIYGPWIDAAALAVYHRAGSPKVRKAARRYLRARATWMALQAASSTPKILELRFGLKKGEVLRRPLRFREYRGLTTHCPGMRAESRDGDGSWAEASDLHAWLSWSLEWPGWRPRRPIQTETTPEGPQWALRMARLLGAGAHTSPPAFWGLAPRERELLRDFIHEPSARKARRLVAWLGPLRPQPGLVKTVLRFQEGGVLALQSRETNAVKSTQVGWIAAGQQGEVMFRSAGRHARIAASRLVIWGPGGEWRMSLERFGDEAFRIVGTSNGWKVLAHKEKP